MDESLLKLLTSPIAVSFVVNALSKFIEAQLAKVDSSKLTDNYGKIILAVQGILTSLGSLAALALQHKAETFDVSAFLNYFATLFVTAHVIKAAATGFHDRLVEGRVVSGRKP